MKEYKITVCSMVDGVPGHTIIELMNEEGYNALDFPTLQKAEAFSFFLLGLGYKKVN